MQTHIQAWLARSGFPGDSEITTMTPGLGNTMLWRISGAEPRRDLVLRMFPSHDTASVQREALAMRTVSQCGLPAPGIVATGAIEDRPVMLIAFVPGQTVAAAIEETPERAAALGEHLGVLFGRLHGVVAPLGLAAADRWIEKGGSSLAPLHTRLRAVPHADRLLHLDYHPQNLLVDDQGACTIIDWTNALPGPPHMDLARTRSILDVAAIGGRFSGSGGRAVERFLDGLTAGHTQVAGPDPHPELSAAWGWAMTVDDVAQHVGKPGSWVTAELVASLEKKRDGLIARAMAHS